jgi:UDP-N-acetylmuramate dehydrogenase
MTGSSAKAVFGTDLLREIEKIPELFVRRNFAGAACTTFAIGGPLEIFLEPSSLSALTGVIQLLHREGLPSRVLGAGSNVLIDDEGIPGFTIRLGKGFRSWQELGSGRFLVGAGMSLMSLSRDTADAGFSGLEFAGGIPASIGGAVRMNAGAHGGEMSSVIQSIEVVTPTGELQQAGVSELGFSYRHSELPPGCCIVGATLQLIPSTREKTSALRAEHLAERKKRQPLSSPSAGSVFKNPSPTRSAGAVLDEAGLKGVELGGAQVSRMHANWIINPKRTATAFDVRSLIKHCQSEAQRKVGVALQPEVILWGGVGKPLS